MNPLRKYQKAKEQKERLRLQKQQDAEKARKSVSLAENFLLNHRNKDPMAPWVVFPHLDTGHIGWRMGPGEYYLNEWYKIFATFSKQEKEEYFSKYDLGVEWPYREEWYQYWIVGYDDEI